MGFSTNNSKWGFKVLALIVFALITIATCAGVWNYCPEVFIKILAGVLGICNIAAIVWIAKLISKSDE